MSSGRSHQSARTDGYGELHRRALFFITLKGGAEQVGSLRRLPSQARRKTSTCGYFGKGTASAVPYFAPFSKIEKLIKGLLLHLL